MTCHDAHVQTFYGSALAAYTADLIVTVNSAVVDTAYHKPIRICVAADTADVVIVGTENLAVIVTAENDAAILIARDTAHILGAAAAADRSVVGAKFYGTAAELAGNAAAVVPVQIDRSIIDTVADKAVAVACDAASERIIIAGVNGGVLCAVIHHTAVCDSGGNTALTVVRSIGDIDLTVNVDDMTRFEQSNDAADLIVALDGSFYRQVAYNAAVDTSEQSGVVVFMGVVKTDDSVVVAVEAAPEPMICEPDRRPVDARQVDIAIQVNRLFKHIMAALNEQRQTAEVGRTVDIQIGRAAVIPACIFCAVPDTPVRAVAVLSGRTPIGHRLNR